MPFSKSNLVSTIFCVMVECFVDLVLGIIVQYELELHIIYGHS